MASNLEKVLCGCKQGIGLNPAISVLLRVTLSQFPGIFLCLHSYILLVLQGNIKEKCQGNNISPNKIILGDFFWQFMFMNTKHCHSSTCYISEGEIFTNVKQSKVLEQLLQAPHNSVSLVTIATYMYKGARQSTPDTVWLKGPV